MTGFVNTEALPDTSACDPWSCMLTFIVFRYCGDKLLGGILDKLTAYREEKEQQAFWINTHCQNTEVHQSLLSSIQVNYIFAEYGCIYLLLLMMHQKEKQQN